MGKLTHQLTFTIAIGAQISNILLRGQIAPYSKMVLFGPATQDGVVTVGIAKEVKALADYVKADFQDYAISASADATIPTSGNVEIDIPPCAAFAILADTNQSTTTTVIEGWAIQHDPWVR